MIWIIRCYLLFFFFFYPSPSFSILFHFRFFFFPVFSLLSVKGGDQNDVCVTFYFSTPYSATTIKSVVVHCIVHCPSTPTPSYLSPSKNVQVPLKTAVLGFIDSGRRRPGRAAIAVLYRGDLDPPRVEEHIVGPLPRPTYHRRATNPAYRHTPIPFCRWGTLPPFRLR